MCSRTKSSLQLFRAPWVIPVAAPVLEDGAVVVEGDRIVAVGPYSEMSHQFADLSVTPCSGILMPPLVNAHIHLDLSIYGTVHMDSEGSTMCDWIRALLKKRQEAEHYEEEIRAAAEKAAFEQHAAGVGLMLDIGNVALGTFDSSVPEIKPLFEQLAPSKSAELAVIDTIEQMPDDLALTGHAPYSTTPELLRYIKERCTRQGELFSIHLAENPDESLLLISGEGCFPQFLQERGAWDGTYPITGIDRDGVVGYLDLLGVFDNQTLCVHCVHISPAELAVIASSGAHICLCPQSNRFLGVGTAPLPQMLEHGILPAIGTDSTASNPFMDMWREIALVRQTYPEVAAETVLAMATLGGARAMQREKDYGSLEAGRTSQLLHVEDRRYEGAENGAQLLELLTSCGRPHSISWL